MTFDFSISTERLQLRLLQEDDIDEIYEALSSHPEITKLLTFDPPTRRQDTADFVHYMLPRIPEHDVLWTVRMDGKFIGLAGINDIERKVLAWEIHNGNIGYWFLPEVAGKGFATEVAEAVVEAGFNEFGLHKISGRIVIGNDASGRILEKVGFRFIGEQKEHFYRNEQWWDCKWFEIVNKNFVQKQ